MIIKSESISKLFTALKSAKAEFAPVLKQNENPGFKRFGKPSKYADLETAIRATEPALLKYGIVVSQFPVNEGDRVGALTLLVHESGEYLGESFTLPLGQQNAQTGVAAVTYARRTGYLAGLGIAAEDDDGNTAAGRTDVVYDEPVEYEPAPIPPPIIPRSRRITPQPAAIPASFDEIPESGNPEPAAEIAESQPELAMPASSPGTLPTEKERNAYRARFVQFVDSLKDAGFKPSKNLTLSRKAIPYLLQVTGQTEVLQISTTQWDTFFEFVGKLQSLDDGAKQLVKLVNDAATAAKV